MTDWLMRFLFLHVAMWRVAVWPLGRSTPDIRAPANRRHTGRTARIGTGLLTAVLWCVCAAGAAQAATAPTILVLGDSISAAYGIQREQGWVAHLEQRVAGLEDGWRVVNASTSGETTAGGLARLPGALATHAPEVVIIELGGNDGLRGYPIERIRDNLSRLVDLATEHGSEVLLVGMEIPPNYGPRYTRAFREVFRDVATIHEVPLVPFLLEQVALLPDLMQDDGIHPTADAQRPMLDTLWPYLQPLLAR